MEPGGVKAKEKMEIKKTLTGSGARKVLGGANFLIYTAVVLAILVVANISVNQYFHRRWDLTPSKKYSLSPQTKKIVSGLKKDVAPAAPSRTTTCWTTMPRTRIG
jgi:hypothetical protein